MSNRLRVFTSLAAAGLTAAALAFHQAGSAGASATITAATPCVNAAAPAKFSHVILIMEENHSYGQVIGPEPYETSLAKACGLASNDYAAGYPSLPNYMALTGGSILPGPSQKVGRGGSRSSWPQFPGTGDPTRRPGGRPIAMMKPILGISVRAWVIGLVVGLTAAVLVGSQLAHSHSHSAPSARERVGSRQTRLVLDRAFAAVRQLSRHRGLCPGCYPASAADLTEDLYDASGIQFAVAFTPFGAHIPGVVYLDTVGADRLSHTHLTFYARTSDGTVFQLDADRGRVHLFQAE